MLRHTLSLTLVLLLSMTGCSGGGGGGGGSTTAAANTGSVGVLLTDGPADFARILITVSRIELLGSNRVDLFVGDETFDLLDLENSSDVFAIAEDVPVGPYDKVRLHIEDLVLECEVDDGNGGITIEEIRPPLPANGKIDLNPRESFAVAPGELLLLEIDIDANKSIHIVQTGNGGYRFRPVVFIRVIEDVQDMEKLSRVFGVIDSFQGSDAFTLCSDAIQTRSADDGSAKRSCLRVNLFTDTTAFDENGDPMPLGSLMVGDPVTIPGTLRVLPDRVELDAIVVELGPLGTFPRIDGIADGPVDPSDVFDLDVDDGQAVPAGLVPIQLAAETALITREGFSLDRDQIDVDVPVEVDGVPRPDAVAPDDVAAALVIVSPPAFDAMEQSGTIDRLMPTDDAFDLIGSSQTWCVDVTADTVVLTVSDGGSIAESTEAELSDLSDGMSADVFGELVGSCIEADAVVAFLP